MIANNLAAMRTISETRQQRLTSEFICDLQRIVTEGTLDDPSAAGRFQAPGEERVEIYNRADVVLHRPPAADLLPARIDQLCAFANGETDTGYLPPVLRAITLHFMLGYEHPFLDGNGRTARALFYWSMLRHGYWLTEFLSISRVLRQAPGEYARSFLHTETDDNDLTYFFIYQLSVLHRAIDELQVYLERKMFELRALRDQFDPTDELFNHRQLALLRHAMSHPAAGYTVESHRAAHRVVTETARQDLIALAGHGLLTRRRSGKRFVFAPARDLAAKLEEIQAAGNLGHHDE
jgi:Fic family protein